MGLLESIFAREVDINGYLSTNDTDRWSTFNDTYLEKELVGHVSDRPRVGNTLQQFGVVLTKVSRHIAQYSTRVNKNKNKELRGLQAVLAQGIRLGQRVAFALNFSETIQELQPQLPKALLEPQLEKLQRSGDWCAFRLAMLSRRASYTVFHELWHLQLSRKRSSDSHGSDLHSGCRDVECMHDQDKVLSTPVHRSGCKQNDCCLAKATLCDVQSAIKTAQVPLIVLPLAGPLPTQLETQIAQPGAQYLAISHVWWQGRGSDTETGVPICQMEHIRNLLRVSARTGQAQRTVLLWMDSFCIPQDRVIRKMAINQMARVYKEAEMVVVIDDDLAEQPRGDNNLIEASYRILLSSWMSRLWTFQEGNLAGQLAWLFSDGAVLREGPSASATQSLVVGIPLTTAHRTQDLPTRCRLLVPGLLADTIRDYVLAMDIAQHLNELYWRSTSRSTDETVALSISLGISPSVVYGSQEQEDRLRAEAGAAWDAKGATDLEVRKQFINLQVQEQRMVRFLQESKYVPEALLYSHVQRITIPSFGWAPTSLMQTGHGAKLTQSCTMDNVAECTSHGLCGTFKVFPFEKPSYNGGSTDKRLCVVMKTQERTHGVALSVSPHTLRFGEDNTSTFPQWSHLVVSSKTPPLSECSTANGFIVWDEGQWIDDDYKVPPQTTEWKKVHYLGAVRLLFPFQPGDNDHMLSLSVPAGPEMKLSLQ
jgi:hypothetical protein